MSAFPINGTWPTGAAQCEKRNIVLEMPVLDEHLCISAASADCVAGALPRVHHAKSKTRDWELGLS